MVSSERLRQLRAKFSEGGGGDIYNEHFAKVARTVFSGDRRRAPYAGVSTLLDAPWLPADEGVENLGDLQIALVGVPTDLGVTNRPGARFGPRAVRGVERIGPYHHVLDMVPVKDYRVADVGDVPFRSRYSLDQTIEDIETFYTGITDAGVRTVSVGGDHSVTYPILKAVGRNQPVGLVHIDAHCDTAGAFEGTKFHHGSAFRHAVLDGVLDPDRTVQIGIRGATEYLWEFSYESGMTVIHAEEFHRMGVEEVLACALDIVGNGPVYVSLDVDGIDPAFAPGTGTPEVGGLSPREAQLLLHGLKDLDIIGGDVVEVAPQYDTNTTTAQVGAQMLFEILCLTARRLPRP